jgi:predicted RNase H-like HicB family nuclease
MTAIVFPAIVERSATGFGIHFPDLPGCVSAGDTVAETVLNGEQALAMHLAGMREDGEAIPEPSSIDAIEGDPDIVGAVGVVVMGELPTWPSRPFDRTAM